MEKIKMSQLKHDGKPKKLKNCKVPSYIGVPRHGQPDDLMLFYMHSYTEESIKLTEVATNYTNDFPIRRNAYIVVQPLIKRKTKFKLYTK